MSLLSAAFHRVVPSQHTLAPVNYLGAFAFPHEIFSWVLDEMLVGCVTMFPPHADVPALSRALVPPLRASTPPQHLQNGWKIPRKRPVTVPKATVGTTAPPRSSGAGRDSVKATPGCSFLVKEAGFQGRFH